MYFSVSLSEILRELLRYDLRKGCVKVILWLTSKWESCSELTAVKLKTLLIWLINRFDSGLYASSRWGTGRGVFDSAWVVWLCRLDIFLSLCRSALRYWCPAMIGNNGRYLTVRAFMNSIGEWGKKTKQTAEKLACWAITGEYARKNDEEWFEYFCRNWQCGIG